MKTSALRYSCSGGVCCSGWTDHVQSKAKILVVDDEPLIRMSHIYAELGRCVRSAEDGFSDCSRSGGKPEQ